MCLQGPWDPGAALASTWLRCCRSTAKGFNVQGEGRGKQDSFFGGCLCLGHLQMVMKPQPKLICIRVRISAVCEIQSFT